MKKYDEPVTRWMAKNGIKLLRISIGIVFFWFGILKFFPGVSPAENLAINTIHVLTLGIVPHKVIIIGLAFWETVIGIGLIFGIYMREILFILFLQMAGTLTPLFLFPEQVFRIFPYALTIEGQYIVKNLVIISAGIVIGATVQGGRLINKPVK